MIGAVRVAPDLADSSHAEVPPGSGAVVDEPGSFLDVGALGSTPPHTSLFQSIGSRGPDPRQAPPNQRYRSSGCTHVSVSNAPAHRVSGTSAAPAPLGPGREARRGAERSEAPPPTLLSSLGAWEEEQLYGYSRTYEVQRYRVSPSALPRVPFSVTACPPWFEHTESSMGVRFQDYRVGGSHCSESLPSVV